MCTLYRKLNRNHLSLFRFLRQYSKINNFNVKDEVRVALQDGRPVVALESTIITHGMPYPQNIKCALEVEAVVRSQGAIPATLAIVEGQIKIGLDENELEQLGDVAKSQPIKTSRRDLAYVISNKLNGGTTVSGTLIIAKMIGIQIFATGGIGGVHRGGENTFDISADLNELGKSNVAVVSSGVKSILDIPKTLEYLETQGVFVAAFGSGNDFPSFYTRKSGSFAPYSVGTARQAAEIIHCSRNLGLESGMLFAVPVPEKFSLDERIINSVIEEALKDAERDGIGGKEITPFLLKRIGEISGGKSLETNMALIKNNAKVAASISVELSNIVSEKRTTHSEEDKIHRGPYVQM